MPIPISTSQTSATRKVASPSQQPHPSQNRHKPIHHGKSNSKTHAINTSARRSIQHEYEPTLRCSRRRQIISFRVQRTANRRPRTSHILRRRSRSRNRIRRPNQPRHRSTLHRPPRRCRSGRYVYSSIRNLRFSITHGIVCATTYVIFWATICAIRVWTAAVVWS
jgi:hypothetical protein